MDPSGGGGRGARVVANSALLFLARIGVLLFSVLLTVAVARFLGADGLGGYSLVVSLAVIFQTVASLGLNYILPREVGRDRTRTATLFVNASYLSAAAALAFGWLLSRLGRWMGYEPEVAFCLALAGASVLPGTLVALCEAVFTAHEDVRTVTVVTAIEYLARYAVSLAVLVPGGGLTALTVVFVASRFLGLGASLFYLVRRVGRPRLRPDAAILRAHLSLMPVFAGLYVLVVVMLRADVVILSKIRGVAEAGIYSAAFRIYDLCALVPSTAATVVYPLLAERAAMGGSSREPLGELTRRSLSALFAIGLPIVLLVAFFAGTIVGLLYDPTVFAASVPCLAVLMLTLLPYSLDPILGYAMLAAGRQKADLALVGIGAGATIGLNIGLSALAGARGAAAATFLATLLLAGLHARYVTTHLFPLGLARLLARPALAALAAGAALATSGGLSSPARATLAMGAYVFVLAVTGFLRREDVAALKAILSRTGAAFSRRT